MGEYRGSMGTGRKNIHRSFAGVSLGIVLAAVCAIPCSATGANTNTAAKREAASAQFGRAQEMRAALNEKAPEKRTLADYRRVVATYQRVYLITPHAMEVPDAMVAVGELDTEMGDRFGRSYYQAAAEAYQFLIREYPTNKFAQDAMLRVAQLQKDQLGDAAGATKTYQDFQKKYPRSAHKREVQEALAELALLRNAASGQMDAKTAQQAPAPATAPAASAARTAKEENLQPVARASGGTSGGEKAKSGAVPSIQHIRCTLTPDGTEVVIDLEDTVEYVSGRIANPDRIYFDLHAARLSPALLRSNIRVSGELLTQVRVAQNHGGVVRVVLDVNGVKDYAASVMQKPARLVIELYGTGGARGGAVQSAKTTQPATKSSSSDKPDGASDDAIIAANAPVPSDNSLPVGPVEDTTQAPPPVTPKPIPSPVKILNTSHGKTGGKPDLVQPPAAPVPTRDGQSTLTRTLGLKIGRIVIDAGHGGHDTGTIGPTGLMEKDLCLDVALRLGKIIQQKLPGADIVFTRSDDTFIPLEDRTRIANEAKADLFISIHANSSPDHEARGIETYYLNMKGSPEAMAVAARENAVSQEGIHDLEEVVKKIARTEKIDESRELAQDVQDSLSKRIQKTVKPVKNRGVRKAPFVVLIGADMPSILTEISFLSNPSDEQLLKKPEYRQRVAEGLYQGVSDYLQSMNSMTVNGTAKAGRPAPTAMVEQSRNQQ